MTRIGILLFLCAAAAAAENAPARPPALQAKDVVYDAGRVTRGAKLAHTFLLKNVGTTELSVDAKPG